jgi:shikimate kinase
LSTPHRGAILVGMMGAGKSTIGRRLAASLRLPFLDTDGEVERRAGVTIKEIFAREGESGFRDRETRVLIDCLNQARRSSAVIATGGGIIMNEANRELLKCAGLPIFYLHATPDVLFARIKNDRKRPLLQDSDPRVTIDRLYALREPLYREVASVVVDVSSRQATAVERIQRALDGPRGTQSEC